MKLRSTFLFLFLVIISVYPFAATFAQPAYSPEVRSDREMKWMQDSLHINKAQYKKISAISLSYQRNMDKAALPEHAKSKERTQKKLMLKKDESMKSLLNKQQYQRYYKQEKQIRARAKVVYPADRQPL